MLTKLAKLGERMLFILFLVSAGYLVIRIFWYLGKSLALLAK